MQGNECKERTSLDGLKNKLVELRVMVVERWKRRRRGIGGALILNEEGKIGGALILNERKGKSVAR
jgi:hypothetical protein